MSSLCHCSGEGGTWQQYVSTSVSITGPVEKNTGKSLKGVSCCFKRQLSSFFSMSKTWLRTCEQLLESLCDISSMWYNKVYLILNVQDVTEYLIVSSVNIITWTWHQSTKWALSLTYSLHTEAQDTLFKFPLLPSRGSETPQLCLWRYHQPHCAQTKTKTFFDLHLLCSFLKKIWNS